MQIGLRGRRTWKKPWLALTARPKHGHHFKRASRLKHAYLKYVQVDMESLRSNKHLSSKFVRVWAKNLCKSAFEKCSFAERPGRSCNLLYVCVVLCRGRAKPPAKQGKRRWRQIQPQRISIISGPNKQVIFKSINSKLFVVNLLSCARFHVQQLINVLYVCWQWTSVRIVQLQICTTRRWWSWWRTGSRGKLGQNKLRFKDSYTKSRTGVWVQFPSDGMGVVIILINEV